ncbi:PaaI family thioesterase [Salipiger bermudensis]|uniref:PaaI family thioesterase n=1 Tax=Salipiger bermudensis TaxID=344736 RepID=UPI0002E9C0A6|nr:PaaI family thioesterase [Salipiger bermudensis]MAE90556.1 PaaI family thioesterase [Pelagibaca sp.]MBN9675390.1 PaaI family thioesterase [Salipiger bermudensis]
MTIRPDRPLGVIPPQTLASHSGLDLFAKMIAGDLPSPPVCAVSNQWITAVEKGRVTWTCSPPPNFINPMGGVHGGWAMTVLDSTLACAVHSGLPAGRGYTTVEVKTNLTRAPKVGETYTCVGELITLGRSIGTSEAKLIDAEGRVVAFGTTTCLIMELPG